MIARRSQRFFRVVRLRSRLPADSSFPGLIPAQELRWCSSGNCDMSAPISATTFSIVVRFTPLIASNRSNRLSSRIGRKRSAMR